MMTDRHSFLAFIAVLVAIIAVYSIAAYVTWLGKPVEALGISGVGTGLIGVLGTFKPSNRNTAPIVQTGDSATVNEAQP